MQGTEDQTVFAEREDAEAVLMRLDRVEAPLGVFEDVVVTAAFPEMGAELGGFRQEGDDLLELGLRHADVISCAAMFRDVGTTIAYMVDGADGLVVDAEGI